MIETNGIDRVPMVKNATKVFDIFNANDFLKAAGLTSQPTAPDGVARTPLLEDAKYIIHAAFSLPLFLLPITASSTGTMAIELIGANARQKMLVADRGVNALFWGRKVNQLVLTDLAIIDVGDSGAGQSSTLLNLTGGSRTSRLTFTNVTFAQFAYLGEATDFTLSFNPNVNLVSIGRGFAFDMSPYDAVPGSNSFLGLRLINAVPVDSHGPYLGFTGDQVTTAIMGMISTMAAGDEFIRMDNNNIGVWDIIGNAFDGIGVFISESNKSTSALHVNADLVIDSFSNSTVDPGVDTTVNLAAITKFKRGQKIRIADEAAYNGYQTIVRVADDQLSFDINVVHSTSGAGTLKQTKISSIGHGFILNEGITITDTTGYNGDTVINQIANDHHSYEIPEPYVTAETSGTATSSPKTHHSAGVTSKMNGQAPESKRIAVGNSNGNAGFTAFTSADVYIGMNLKSVITNQLVTERFSLISDIIGLYKYDDPRPVTVRVDMIAWVVKSGSTLPYRFALDKNAQAPIFTKSITSVSDNGAGKARFNYTGAAYEVDQVVIIKGYTTNTDYNGTHIITAVASGYLEIGALSFGTDEAGGEAETPYSIAEVKTTSIMVMFTGFVDIVQNDTLRVRIAPDGHTDSCTITDFNIAITAI